MAKEIIPDLFHTTAGTPIKLLRLITGDVKFKSVWVTAHPGEGNNKEITTHIDLSAVQEGEEAVLKFFSDKETTKTS